MPTSSFIASKRIFVMGGILMSAAAMAADGAGGPDILHGPSVCVPPGADYVPGVDAYGRPVAPADLPNDSGIRLSREVSPKIHSANPQIDGMRVTVKIEDPDQAQTAAPCALPNNHR